MMITLLDLSSTSKSTWLQNNNNCHIHALVKDNDYGPCASFLFNVYFASLFFVKLKINNKDISLYDRPSHPPLMWTFLYSMFSNF